MVRATGAWNAARRRDAVDCEPLNFSELSRPRISLGSFLYGGLIMNIDRYTKFMLTMLVVGVWALAAAIFFQPTPLQAFENNDINIDRIGGSSVYGALPVEVEGTIKIEFAEDPVFELAE